MLPMLSDFGGFPASRPRAVYRVADLEGLKQQVSQCAAHGEPMRTRCFGHSMNGMAVPRRDEMLIDLAGVRHVRWNGRGMITVGAGLAVWELDQYVRQFGWKLPVANDGGGSASSVGGFIAAGGIGEGCMFHGGFWETVSSMVIVTAAAEVRRIDRKDPLFPWVFGSLGALAVVYEAVIRLVPASNARPRPVPDVASHPVGPHTVWPPHLWLTLFVAEDQRNDAIACLAGLTDNNPDVWRRRSAYEYFLRYRRFNPPLILRPGGNFIALGVWGDRSEKDHDLRGYMTMEAEFQAIVEERGWRRYYQSELVRDRRPLERYIGSDCADAFRRVKSACDPGGLLNAFMTPP